jgi:hypothetical protein
VADPRDLEPDDGSIWIEYPSHYAALTAAIEEDSDRRGIGPAARRWAREIAVVLAADQAAALVPAILKIVAAFLGIPH